ncbi:unnamed protein product, partial [marine sediment metagenome]
GRDIFRAVICKASESRPNRKGEKRIKKDTTKKHEILSILSFMVRDQLNYAYN